MVGPGGNGWSDGTEIQSSQSSLADFLPAERFEYTLVVAHPSAEWLSESNFEQLFGSPSIEISHLDVPEVDQDRLFLFHEGDVIASSPVRAVTDAVAEVETMIASGTARLESLELPSILVELDEVPFAAAGPDGTRLKLLFTMISRHIEATALDADAGKLRVGFQRLSRIGADQEAHTRNVYDQLAESNVAVYAYGQPDAVPPASLEMIIHGGHTEDLLRNWFLVYRAPEQDITVAFVAHDHGPGAWRGFWTFQPDRVNQINDYLQAEL